MSRFDGTPAAPDAQTMKIEIGGNYYCQHCSEDVDFAYYLPEKHILTWKCPEGHISLIDEFSI